MLIDTWYYQLGTIPESIAMVALGTALIKEKFTWKQIFTAGLLVGMIGFLLQQLPIEYGVHVPLGIIVMILICCLVLKLRIAKSAAVALISFIVLVLVEWITVLVQTRLLGFTEEQIIGGSDLSRFLFSLPPLIIFMVISLFLQLRLHYSGRRSKDRA